VEYLQAELDFRASEIKRAQQQLDDGDPFEDFVARINRLSIQELRKLARGFFDSTLSLQVSGKRGEEMQKQQELLLAEARRELDQEKQSRLLYEREADARLTKAQREYEQKVLFLFSQMPRESGAQPADGCADSEAHHQQVLADTHRLLELKREQVCILNAENDKQRDLVADLEKRLEAERLSHAQSRAAAEQREAEFAKKLTEARSGRPPFDSAKLHGNKGGDSSDSSTGTRDLFGALPLSSKVDSHVSRSPYSVATSASHKANTSKSLSSYTPSAASSLSASPSRLSSGAAVLPVQVCRFHLYCILIPVKLLISSLQDVSGNIALPSLASTLAEESRGPSAASDHQVFQRHVALTAGGAVAAVSEVSPALTESRNELQRLQQQDAAASPSRLTATSAEGDADMTTLIIDIQVICMHYMILKFEPVCVVVP
jgi:hypothetical protein